MSDITTAVTATTLIDQKYILPQRRCQRPPSSGFAEIVSDDFPILHANETR
jgi:hypothetical protein